MRYLAAILALIICMSSISIAKENLDKKGLECLGKDGLDKDDVTYYLFETEKIVRVYTNKETPLAIHQDRGILLNSSIIKITHAIVSIRNGESIADNYISINGL